MPSALIVGLSGQDGAYLARLLDARGVKVHGTVRGESVPAALGVLGITDAVTRHHLDVTTPDAVAALLDAAEPDFIYHLAGTQPHAEHPGTVASIDPWIAALKTHAPKTRLFVAVSAAAFGPGDTPAGETTLVQPADSHGAAHAAQLASVQRARADGLFAAAGLLFGHESRLAPPAALLQRIVRAALAASRDEPATLEIADLDASIDCGWAAEYVDAMLRALLAGTAADHVIATGRPLRIGDAIERAFGWFKRDWAPHVRIQAGAGPHWTRLGDPAQTQARIGWKATTYGDDLIEVLCEGAAAAIRG